MDFAKQGLYYNSIERKEDKRRPQFTDTSIWNKHGNSYFFKGLTIFKLHITFF